MTCINIKHKDFIELQEATGLPALILELQVAEWQQVNQTDKIPTEAQLRGITVDKLVEYNNNESLQLIGNKYEFGKFVNEYQEFTEVTEKVLEDFNKYVIENFDQMYDSEFIDEIDRTVYDPVKIDDSVPELFGDYTAQTIERIKEHNVSKMFNKELNTVQSVIERITKDSEMTSEALKMFEKISKFGKNINVVLQSSDSNKLMAFNPQTGNIEVNSRVLGEFSVLQVTQAFLHEVAHERSLNALINPKTAEEIAFKDLMTEFYNEHNDKSDSYGFTSVEEMVAEIYANPAFRNEIQNIPATDKKNSIWSSILDAIRRLFGLSKTSHNQSIIDSVVNHVESNTSTFETILDSPLFFAPDRHNGINTLEDRILLLNNRVLDNVDQIVNINKYSKLKTDNITIEARKEKLANLQDLLNKQDLNKDIMGVSTYVKLAIDITKGLEVSLRRKISDYELDYPTGVMSNESSQLDQIESYMSLYQLNTDVQGVLTDAIREYEQILKSNLEQDPTIDPKETEEGIIINELKEVMNNFSKLDANHKSLKALIVNYRQKYAKELISKSSNLAPKIDTDLQLEYEKEYNMKVKNNEDVGGLTKREYTQTKMNSDEGKSRKSKLMEEFAHDLVYSEFHEDISSFSLNWQDPLNIDNSPLIASTVSLISRMRISAIEDIRRSNRSIGKLEKEFSAFKDGKPSEKFKNIYEIDENGNYYLKGDYSVRYVNDYDNMFNKVARRLLNISDKVKVEASEIDSFNGDNSTYVFRTKDSTTFAKNKRVSLTTNDKFTDKYVKVENVNNYNSVEDVDKNTLNNLLAVFGFTSFDQFEKSNSNFDTSKFAKSNPEFYNFLKGRGSIQAVQLTKIKLTETQRTSIFKDNEFNNWRRENTIKVKNKYLPSNKYKNDLSGLSEIEKKTLDHFKSISDTDLSNKSLRKKYSGMDTSFYKLPSRNKTQREYIIEGKIKDTVKAMGRDFTSVEKDDIEYGEKLDAKGQILQSVKLHYRGQMEPELQSLDLFTLYRDEAANLIAYKKKKETLPMLNTLKEVSANKKYVAKSSISGKVIQKLYSKRIKEQTFEGSESKEFKKIVGLIEANIFDVKSYSSGKLGSTDVNKIVNSVNGTVATVGLTFNYVSGIANITNGFSQMMLDSIGGRHFSAKELFEAEAEYTKEIGELAADLGRPNKTAKANQLMEIFDLMGGLNPESQDYLYNNAMKKLISRKSAGFMQDMGEHAMAAILMYSIMKGIKVTNVKGLFVDKEGNVTTENKAASLFDMIVKNEDGTVDFSDKFYSTSHSPTIQFNTPSGKSQTSLLIKKRMHDMFGAHDTGLQPEIYKEAWGKTVLMFKRFLLPGMNYRYKGFTSAFKDPSKLTDDDRFYNFAAKQYEEGYYTTLVRFLIHGVISSAKQLNFEVLRNYKAGMSDMERRNLRKAFVELGMTALLLPVLRALFLAAFDDEDEDNQFLYSTVYQIRRLEMELSQFRNPLEASKILSNPIASGRYIQNVLQASYETVTFLNLTPEEDQPVFDWMRENNKGENILLNRWQKVLPVWAQLGKDHKLLLNNIDK